MHPLVNIAVRAARAGGTQIVRNIDQLDRIEVEQKSKNDFVSSVDKAAEQEIIYHIRKAYPDHEIIAEESGQDGKNDFQWIIDPLDGTTNFLHGIPHYAVSIACAIKGRLEAAVIYNPVTDELYTANRGGGAMVNNKRIRVSNRDSLDGALIGTGIPFSPERDLDGYVKTMRNFMGNTAGLRRMGAASLDLAYVASGKFDGYWEEGLKIWDMAAGVLLVQEAGGLVAETNGGKDYLTSGNIVCGTPKVYNEMLPLVAKK